LSLDERIQIEKHHDQGRSAWQLRKAIRANIDPGSKIIPDGLSAYRQATAGYIHEPRNESAPGAPPATFAATPTRPKNPVVTNVFVAAR
jgi:hypothetical protein